jgi:hypothetical protein
MPAVVAETVKSGPFQMPQICDILAALRFADRWGRSWAAESPENRSLTPAGGAFAALRLTFDLPSH